MILTPSLSQPVKFPGWIIYGRACKRYIFRSYNIYFFNAMRFDENPFTCQCEKQDKKDEGFQISRFYWSFSSDIVTVKGLIKIFLLSKILFTVLSAFTHTQAPAHTITYTVHNLQPIRDCICIFCYWGSSDVSSFLIGWLKYFATLFQARFFCFLSLSVVDRPEGTLCGWQRQTQDISLLKYFS